MRLRVYQIWLMFDQVFPALWVVLIPPCCVVIFQITAHHKIGPAMGDIHEWLGQKSVHAGVIVLFVQIDTVESKKALHDKHLEIHNFFGTGPLRAN